MTGLFYFEKTGVFDVEIEELEATWPKATQIYFFATPTRLADGLGTKEYPFITK